MAKTASTPRGKKTKTPQQIYDEAQRQRQVELQQGDDSHGEGQGAAHGASSAPDSPARNTRSASSRSVTPANPPVAPTLVEAVHTTRVDAQPVPQSENSPETLPAEQRDLQHLPPQASRTRRNESSVPNTAGPASKKARLTQSLLSAHTSSAETILQERLENKSKEPAPKAGREQQTAPRQQQETSGQKEPQQRHEKDGTTDTSAQSRYVLQKPRECLHAVVSLCRFILFRDDSPALDSTIRFRQSFFSRLRRALRKPEQNIPLFVFVEGFRLHFLSRFRVSPVSGELSGIGTNWSRPNWSQYKLGSVVCFLFDS